MSSVNFLNTGIFTVVEAAALLGVPKQKVRGWISGWPGTSKAPVVENELGWVDGHLAFSFANLMELRFIAFFEGAGVTLHEIRAIIGDVRKELERPHPFATNIVFKTDGSKIVAEIAHKNGVENLFDLKTKNYEMKTVIYRSLKDGIVYDPHGNAMAWFPNKAIAPNVIVHSRLAFGRPTLKGSGVPTEAIAQTAHAEGSIAVAAELFEVPLKRAEEAVSFENYLRRAA
jgi:uncharacterized protein (DUF433 family)/DNA-binding transcriptional MerR regulator